MKILWVSTRGFCPSIRSLRDRALFVVLGFLKSVAFGALIALGALWFAQAGHAQGTLAPLYVFTNGDGSITPYQSGQLLQVGQTYDITAIPDAGYEFCSWEPVDVFVITQTNYDSEGEPILPPLVSIVPSVVPTNIYVTDLEFAMQDTTVITLDGSNPNVVQAYGWQANFEPVPESADMAIVGWGFAAMTVGRRIFARKRRKWLTPAWRAHFLRKWGALGCAMYRGDWRR